MKPAVFLDRDGTIVEDTDFLTDLADLRLLPGASQAIRKLNQGGWIVVVVTNQSGVARGYLTETSLQAIHKDLQKRLGEEGAHLDRIYYCPHHPTVGPPDYRLDCSCRKPKPGMFLTAAEDLDLDLKNSFAIGDSLRDGQAAQAAGVTPLLVHSGPGAAEAKKEKALFPWQGPDLLAAVNWIQSNRQTP